MFLSFSLHAKEYTTQTIIKCHSLCEARQEKTKEFQTQLLHSFSKSDIERNHHQSAAMVQVYHASNSGHFGLYTSKPFLFLSGLLSTGGGTVWERFFV